MLKLQKIAMLGFKSFADNTEIAFTGTGIAAVVGPNGCGKSNLSDAISWVLGEQSPRSLRSSRMQDVIFNGTPNRKPTGMAEVKLTLFDPDAVEQPRPASAEVIAISGEPVSHPKERHQQDDSGIITIARRLFQSGESEYLLNGRACRLRDIHEIFLGTGLGPDSYAIIEQGRIGQLLSAKPYERRALVEEAAGVTKFKAKRKLAWAKLESSKQNLARVSDILEEIRRQLNSLQRQASRARRHSELRSQLRTQTQSLLANQFRLLTEEAARISGEVATLDQSLQESHAQIASQENERQTLRLQLVHEETELRQSVEERSTLRLNAEKARSQVVSQSQQIIFLGNRITEAARELELLSARLADLNAERQQAQVSQDAVQSDIAACNTQLQNHEGQFRAAQDELKQDASRLEQLRMETLEAVHRSATLSNQILQLEQFLSTTERQIDQTRIQCTAVESMRAAANHKCETTRESLEKQRATAQSLANKRMSLEDTLAAGKLEQSYLQVSIEELRSHVSGQRARLSSIEEILNRHAYTSETVQKLFDLHTSKKNSSADASSSAHFEPAGVLADYLEVDPTYEKVVEEFLKEELDYVVVRNWDVASEGVRLLKSEVSGRATFLLDSAIANSTAAPAPMSGVIATLESCLRFTNGFTNSAGHLIPKLRKSYLVSSADAGRALALEHPECYFLAPDGEWLHGGTVTAGRVDSRGPLGLKRELRELARALAAQEEAVAATAQKLASVNSGIASQEADLKVLAQEHQEAEKLLVVAERDLQEATAESQRAAERYSFLALELERLSLEADHARQQREKDALEIHSGEKQKEEIALQVEALRFSLAQREAERESARAQISQIQNQIATLEERRRTAADAFARLHRHCEEVQSKTN
ncbi:MAG: hypothetical protein A3F68_04825 [Acidobacteria bacterium RIFCSPLOWO2_12_FULL_54_10]|nr:MAG: hypothetical protein A3F68_04825 [Acidobacteria bacterium RIFCSPLOWO2_12_FULL_54_10]